MIGSLALVLSAPAAFAQSPSEAFEGLKGRYVLSPAVGQNERCSEELRIYRWLFVHLIEMGRAQDGLQVDSEHFNRDGIRECHDPTDPFAQFSGVPEGICRSRRFVVPRRGSLILEERKEEAGASGRSRASLNPWIERARFERKGALLTVQKGALTCVYRDQMSAIAPEASAVSERISRNSKIPAEFAGASESSAAPGFAARAR